MHRRHIAYGMVLVLLVAAAGLCCWPMVRWFHWRTHPTPENRQPRPMFHEWRDHDWGPGWGMMGPFRDSSGATVTTDTTLNILVLFATGDRDDQSGPVTLLPERAVFRLHRPYETTIEKTENVLVWIGRDARHDLHLAPGIAIEVQRALEQEELAMGRTEGLCRTVMRLYRGNDRKQLEALVRRYIESLDAPLNEATTPDR